MDGEGERESTKSKREGRERYENTDVDSSLLSCIIALCAIFSSYAAEELRSSSRHQV